MNEIELTEQFQTKDALIKRLKEARQCLSEAYERLDNYDDLNGIPTPERWLLRDINSWLKEHGGKE